MSDTVQLAADIADALDPDLSPDQSREAAIRAASRDPEGAAILATSIARMLVADIGARKAGGSAAVMRLLRERMAAIPDLHDL